MVKFMIKTCIHSFQSSIIIRISIQQKLFRVSMICSKCTHWKQDALRVRYTPTFYHSPIFDQAACQHNFPSRCSATYHSTVFDGPHIHRGAQCCCRVPKKSQKVQKKVKNTHTGTKSTIRCSSACKMQRQCDLHPHTHEDLNRLSSRGISNHKLLWYDPDKEVRLMNCSNCVHHGLPRERKLIELTSCPFYSDSAEVVQVENNHPICCHNVQLNNDSLDIINQQASQGKLAETTFGQKNDIKVDEPEQIVEQRQKIIENIPHVAQYKQTAKKQVRRSADPYSRCMKQQKLNTINTCNRTIRRNPNTNCGNKATGKPMFWAVTKNRLK